MKIKHRIYLIGFMGCGKSTIGHTLASHMGASFTDLDEVIVQSLDRSIASIFSTLGAPYFRWIEVQCLRQTETNIVATGGGTPMYYDSMSWMKSMGRVVFINTPYDVIRKRLFISTVDRPLTNKYSEEQLRELYNKRLKTYRQADLIFRPKLDLQEDVNELVTLFNEWR